METSTVASATDTDSGTPATFPALIARRTGTAAPRRARAALATPEHLTRITEAAAVAAVEAFYRPGAGSRGSAPSRTCHVVR